VLPLTWVAGEPAERLALDGDTTRSARDAYARARQADPEGFERFVQGLFAGREFEPRSNPDLQLYDGFIKRGDEGQFAAIRAATAEELANHTWSFEDKRLPELLFRYRARNFPDSLSAAERAQWQEHCEAFLLEQTHGGWQVFREALAAEQALPELSARQQEALADLEAYARQLADNPGCLSPTG
jgi:exodeoxyribonuclease-1